MVNMNMPFLMMTCQKNKTIFHYLNDATLTVEVILPLMSHKVTVTSLTLSVSIEYTKIRNSLGLTVKDIVVFDTICIFFVSVVILRVN